MSRYLVMVALIGCGNVVNDKSPSDAGAPSDSDGPPPGRCDPRAPFGPLEEATSINTEPSTEGAYLSRDELTIWFSSRVAGSTNYDLYEASRSDTPLPFRGIHAVPGVNTEANERWPRVTADGLRMFATIGAAAGPYDMKVATRDNTDMEFAPLQPIPTLSEPTFNDSAPYPISHETPAHETVLYYHSDRITPQRIYRSVNSGSGFRAADPVPIIGLGPQDTVANPVVTPDELTLYFQLANDIWIATRASTSDDFRDPTSIPDLNGSGIDAATLETAIAAQIRSIPSRPTDIGVRCRTAGGYRGRRRRSR
jgi:hypothetical protein